MKAKIAGGELAYDVRGSGPALLLLHAFPLGMAMWDDQARALSHAFQVVRFDCPRLRRLAARATASSPWSASPTTAAALLDHLGIAVGHGVRRLHGRLCRASPSCAATRRACAAWSSPTRKAAADTDQARRTRAEQADKVRQGGAAAIADAVLPKLVGKTTPRAAPAGGRPPARHDPGQSRRAGSRTRWPAWPRARTRRPLLREIRVPTLVVCGEEDVITPPADAEALHAAIAGSTLELLPKAGHLASVETPEAFNRVAGGVPAAGGLSGG